MTKKEIKKAEQALKKGRKSHRDANARRKTYMDSIPKQMYDSMAFEGEPVSLKMLEEHLKNLKNTARPLVS